MKYRTMILLHELNNVEITILIIVSLECFCTNVNDCELTDKIMTGELNFSPL